MYVATQIAILISSLNNCFRYCFEYDFVRNVTKLEEVYETMKCQKQEDPMSQNPRV